VDLHDGPFDSIWSWQSAINRVLAVRYQSQEHIMCHWHFTKGNVLWQRRLSDRIVKLIAIQKSVSISGT